ncbi:hypothetical protein T08_6859 [Trichinella sp. T8]|nr:hypothetical protein T08_6859 [Trichinella sp. T8]
MLLLMLLLMVPEEMLEFEGDHSGELEAECKSAVENSDDAEKMRRLLDEVVVLWSHVAVADAVGDYVVTLEKISEKQLIADRLAVLDQEHDHTLGERIQDGSC